MKETKQRTNIYKAAAIILLAAFLYVIALNGRYCRTGADTVVMFDKWKRELVIPTTPPGYKKPNPMN